MYFTVTLTTAAIMLLCAVPGWLMVKTKLIGGNGIPVLVKLLMYVSQPCLTVYSLSHVSYTHEGFLHLCIAFAAAVILQGLMIGGAYLILRRRQSDVKYRVCTVAAGFGNFGFMGVPLLEALLPGYPEAVAISTVFLLVMNIYGWTVGSAVIARNKKYISVRKMILNPCVLALAVALPLYFTGFQLPSQLDGMITLLGRMSTPLCMIIMGARLATVKLRSVFAVPRQYITVAAKQLIMPLAAYAALFFLPLPAEMKTTLIILAACPVASLVLNFAEMIGEGQESAAGLVLLGTLLSVVTLPAVSLLG